MLAISYALWFALILHGGCRVVVAVLTWGER